MLMPLRAGSGWIVAGSGTALGRVMNVIGDPAAIKSMGARFDEFVASLRYGTIAVNAWTGVGYLTATATWAALCVLR